MAARWRAAFDPSSNGPGPFCPTRPQSRGLQAKGNDHDKRTLRVRFLEHRIGDRRIIRLIQKWLKAGVLEDGVVTTSDRGTGQGSVISPLLANVYLHYVFDLWAERWRRREATGNMIITRDRVRARDRRAPVSRNDTRKV
jgi:hypothetical protein